ncbi:MAG: protein kinase [Deltaproteobacteria bacterium]|nr:protein kinase [Deltaproteobacteria bacterium]
MSPSQNAAETALTCTPADRLDQTSPAVAPLGPRPTDPGSRLERVEGEREDTVTLDRDQQDKWMQLRAEQDKSLKQTVSGQTTVMFTDLSGSTAYYEKYGDIAGRQKMLSHNALLFPVVRTHDGTIVKTIGDGIMICFPSAANAVAAALNMMLTLESYNASVRRPDDEIQIRIGINHGPAIAEDGDLHGDAVNVAARVQAEARAGEVLVTEAVATEAPSGHFEPLGKVALRGKAEPVALLHLRWHDDSAPHATDVPRTLATRYRLGRAIGRGPLGVVYAAEDLRLRVPVAVKVLHDFVRRDPRFGEGFLERVQTMASLLSRHIVRVLDCSADWTREPYYITERIDAPDLNGWVLRHGCPSSRRAARIVAQVAETVAYAHRHGVVHGNLKPENILVRSDSHPVVTDFCVATLPRQVGDALRTPIFPPTYQAPEAVMGERADPRTDVYSLGAVLYFLVLGRPPFESSATLQAERAVASGMYRRPERVNPKLPPLLTGVINAAMALKPADRFATVEELVARLRRFADG